MKAVCRLKGRLFLESLMCLIFGGWPGGGNHTKLLMFEMVKSGI